MHARNEGYDYLIWIESERVDRRIASRDSASWNPIITAQETPNTPTGPDVYTHLDSRAAALPAMYLLMMLGAENTENDSVAKHIEERSHIVPNCETRSTTKTQG
jgi:hypothetical protein